MPLPPNLTKFTTQAPVLVSYPFTDIANATGYVDYFLIESQDNSGKDYHLTPNRDFSNSVKINKATATFDADFDLTSFVLPRTINGIVLISIPIVAAANANAIFTAELYIWDGSSETQIGSTIVFNASPTATPSMLYMRMPVSNKLIPAGKQLRLRFVMAVAGSTTVWFGLDPANRSDGGLSITTTSKITIPYALFN